MSVLENDTVQVETAVQPGGRRGLRRLAIGGVLAAVPLGAVALASGASAVEPTVPDAGATITDAAGNLSTGLLDGFSSALPYVIAVIVAFTVFAMVKRMLGAKKSAS